MIAKIRVTSWSLASQLRTAGTTTCDHRIPLKCLFIQINKLRRDDWSIFKKKFFEKALLTHSQETDTNEYRAPEQVLCES